jgi:hypothetical protein
VVRSMPDFGGKIEQNLSHIPCDWNDKKLRDQEKKSFHSSCYFTSQVQFGISDYYHEFFSLLYKAKYYW